MDKPDFYIASTEDRDMEQPRKAWRVRRMQSEHRDDLLLLRLDPALSFTDENGFEGPRMELVIVAARFREDPLFPIEHWPVPVYVLRPLVPDPEARATIRRDEYVLEAWAELYPTEETARRKTV